MTRSAPPRVLFVVPSRGRGGVEEYILTIARASVRAGWSASAAFPHCVGMQSLAQDLQDAGVRCFDLPLIEPDGARTRRERWAREVSNVVKTLRVLRRVRPDVVQLNLPWPSYCAGSMAALAIRNIPTSVVFHLINEEYRPTEQRRRAYALYRRRGQAWLAISNTVKTLVSTAFDVNVSEVQVIRNGKNLGGPPTDHERAIVRDDVRRELGLAPNTRIVLTVGRLDPQKGYDVLIPAIASLGPDLEDVVFVWAGDGSQAGHLSAEIARYHLQRRVRMLGFRRDVTRLLQAADLFAFPTLFEGMPFALLEAMAAGLPVVASDVPSVAEVVNNGVSGILFASRDSQQLAGALEEALRDPERCRAMAARARDRLSDFSEDAMVSRTLELLGVLHEAASTPG